jgi:hypothetical protein
MTRIVKKHELGYRSISTLSNPLAATAAKLNSQLHKLARGLVGASAREHPARDSSERGISLGTFAYWADRTVAH